MNSITHTYTYLAPLTHILHTHIVASVSDRDLFLFVFVSEKVSERKEREREIFELRKK
jgi:hypothetical protein